MRFHAPSYFLAVCLTACLILPVSSSATDQSLADLYKSGKVRFTKDLIITDEDFPEEAFFRNPRGICSHSQGQIYVSDSDAHNIKIFSPEGKLIKLVGQQGQGPGDLYSPSFIDIAGDRLFVWESRNRRFSVMDKDGRFINSLQIAPEKGRTEGMKILPDGRLIVMTEMQVEINKVLQQWYRIFLLSTDLEIIKTIYETKLQRRTLITDPMRMYVPQPFTPYVYWDITPDGRIILGCSDSYEIEVHDPDKGKLFSFSHDFQPVKVNEKDKEQHFGVFTIAVMRGDTREVTQGAPDYIKTNTTFPKIKPAFKNIIADDEGNIWVQTFNENREMEERFFDVFDDKGKFINRVEILGDGSFPNPSYKVTPIENMAFWKIETDEDGFFSIVRYRITPGN